MTRLTIWYRGLNRNTRRFLIGSCAFVALAVVVAIGYMALNPQKVEVRFGTIVRDPVDGHVWEDNTQTAWVAPADAGKYRVEYIDRLSEEHAAQKEAAQQAAAEAAGAAPGATGVPSALTSSFSGGTMDQLNAFRSNITVAGDDIIAGLEMVQQLSDTKATMVSYRNQIASMALPPEVEGMRGKVLNAFDLGIAACDKYLSGIANASVVDIHEANNLVQQATAIIQGLVGSLPQ